MSVSKRDKIILSIVKEVEEGNKNIQAQDFGIDMDMFWEISEVIKDMGLVKNISFSLGKKIDYNISSITAEGMKYLKENSALMKTYRGLKSIREWLPM